VTKSSLSLASSRNRRRKEEVRKILLRRDFAGLGEYATQDKNILRTLSSLLYDSDRLVVWRTIEGLGRVSIKMGEKGLEPLRRLIRQLLWSMNDESGSIGWYAPEAIGEILYNLPSLQGEYLPLLVSNLETEPFGGGICRAMARISGRFPETIRSYRGELQQSLKAADLKESVWATVAMKRAGLLGDWSEVPLNVREYEIEYYDFASGVLLKGTPVKISSATDAN
jgi:hypothetical protein